MKSVVCARGYAAVLMLAAVAVPALAQAPPAIRSIVHYRIKPDKLGDWRAAEKDYAALMAKGGSERSYTIWQSLTGPREFIWVRYYSKWAEMDVLAEPKMSAHAGELAAITARLNAATESGWREIHAMQPDLTLPRPAEMPKMIRVARINAASGKLDELLATMKAITVPAMKSAGVTSYGVGRIRYGGGANQVLTHTGMNSWADLDGPTPIEKSAGRDAYLKYVEKINSLTTRIEWTVYRFQPELSYAAPAR
ncbi:MAG TPA: hypothetical protein VGK29_11060 [Paludibaculum sp.]|jgi:quinol monooxygenase YgiN